jgi:ligand-binding SRPBCC domain-containing protein
MRLRLRTAVRQSPEQVHLGFTEDLFKALAPPFPKAKVLRFDGSTRGDTVHIALNFIFFTEEWHSKITASGENPEGYFFVDEGEKLPFFFRFWRHHHGITRAVDGSTIIVDDVEFRTGTWLTDLLMYPGVWAQFIWRIPIYKKYFA